MFFMHFCVWRCIPDVSVESIYSTSIYSSTILFLFWLFFSFAFTDGKKSECSTGDLGSIPRLGKSSREGNGNPLQYSCLENPMDRGAWQYSPWGRKELDMTERLHFTFHLHQRLFSFLSLSAIRAVSSAYLRLLLFLSSILIPTCDSPSLAFHMMYFAYGLNKQGDNTQP